MDCRRLWTFGRERRCVSPGICSVWEAHQQSVLFCLLVFLWQTYESCVSVFLSARPAFHCRFSGRNSILWYGCRRWDETYLALLVLTTDSRFPGQTNTPNASVRHRFSKLLCYLFKSTSALKIPTSSDYSGFKNQILMVTPKMLHLHFCLIRRNITTFWRSEMRVLSWQPLAAYHRLAVSQWPHLLVQMMLPFFGNHF